MFKMNKRVFRLLAAIQTTPQNQLTKNQLTITSHFDEGKFTYGIHHYMDNLNDYVHWGNNYTLTDLRNFSRLSEPLTGKVALMDITHLVINQVINPAQKHIITKNVGEDHEIARSGGMDKNLTFLHCFHKVKVEPKKKWLSPEDLAHGVF